jgi:hypothetical protein
VAERTGRRISHFEWSGSGAELAFDRERLPGIGRDVFVRRADGTVQQATSPYPDGGDNELVAWMQGPIPGPAPQPRNVRVLEPRTVAQVPAAVRLFQGSPHRVFASLERLESEVDVNGGCGALFVDGRPSYDPCEARRPLLAAVATHRRIAFVIEHSDEGVGDESGACAYVVDLRNRRPVTPADCYPDEAPQGLLRPTRVAFGGWLDIRAAGETLVIGRSYYDEAGSTDDIGTWDGKRLRVIARGTRRRGLVLLDAAVGRVLLRRGNTLQLVRIDGRSVSSRTIGSSFLDAALDGARVVVLRTNAIEQYSAARMRRLVRLGMTPSWVQQPVLSGARGGVAAYLRGTVLHVVRFRDRRQVAVRVPGLVPPYQAAVGKGSVTVAYQRDDSAPSGRVGTIDLREIFR